MAFWKGLFGETTNKFQELESRLLFHEKSSEENLHSTHPHVRGIFTKHDINLRQIRKQGVRVATAAAVLGAFLAIPWLLGHPHHTKIEPDSTGEREITRHISDQEAASSAQILEKTSGQIGTSWATQAPSQPGDQDDQSKSKGHTYGRSYLAPPKEHGLHDLGLHKGEEKNPQVPEVGTHPSDLDIHNKGGE